MQTSKKVTGDSFTTGNSREKRKGARWVAHIENFSFVLLAVYVVNIRKKTVWISHHFFLLPAFIASGVYITSQLLFNDLFVYCNIMLYYSLMGKIILAEHWATQHSRLYFSYCFCPQKKVFWIAITVSKCGKLV